MDNLQQAQSNRILSMYDRLLRGESLKKRTEADRFRVSEKTIQRDIECIRSYLGITENSESLAYCRKVKGYKFEIENIDTNLQSEEILSIAKVLIESRAFPKNDMNSLLDKLTKLAQLPDRKFIEQILLNEKHLYVDLQHKKSLFSMLWKLARAIDTKRHIKIRYQREFDTSDGERILKPVGLIFSEYYFYLIAYQTTIDLDFPTIYRVDRVMSCILMEKRFKLPYAERFQEGEFRKRIQFMHAGELTTIKFKFTGASPQAVLDRLPTARMITNGKQEYLFEAEVFGRGIKMWLLSQGNFVEVLEPRKFRDEMSRVVADMYAHYK